MRVTRCRPSLVRDVRYDYLPSLQLTPKGTVLVHPGKKLSFCSKCCKEKSVDAFFTSGANEPQGESDSIPEQLPTSADLIPDSEFDSLAMT